MKRFMTLFLIVALTSPSLTGCFGKFALTRKVYAVNASVQDKFVRSVVTWAFFIVPVYYVVGLVDLIIMNTIEFWGGSNPIAAGEKSFNYTKGDQYFEVKAVKSAETVTYTIDRYAGGRYLDTLTISTDLSAATTKATYREFGRVTEYLAYGDENGLRTVRAANRLPVRDLSLLSLYR